MAEIQYVTTDDLKLYVTKTQWKQLDGLRKGELTNLETRLALVEADLSKLLNQEATFKKILLTKIAGNILGFDTILEALQYAASGDLITVKPGTYVMGATGITLKNGVNWFFMPGVTITGTGLTGTIRDGGSLVLSQWLGSPLITNTNGDAYRILLTNVGSAISGFTLP